MDTENRAPHSEVLHEPAIKGLLDKPPAIDGDGQRCTPWECLSNRQSWVLGNDGRDEIHHGAYCRGFTQVAVDHNPDVSRKGRDVLVDPDKIALSIAEKARQAGHTYPGPHGDEVLADVVQFASDGTIIGDAEQPALLWHVRVVLIKGDELPAFRRGQMRIASVRIKAERHLPYLPRHAASFFRPHEPHGNVGLATAE
jgi:hypothetical protein